MSTSNEGRNVKMLFRILKKDLKRKKVMNAILLCFILLATMFVASGISNVVSVMNGTDSYLDKAGIGDYVVISMGADSKANIDEILHEMESIRDYRIEPVVFGEKSNLKDMDGEELEAKNSVSPSRTAGLNSLIKRINRLPGSSRGMHMQPVILWRKIICSRGIKSGLRTTVFLLW